MQNSRGILLILVSMAAFTLEDTLLKLLSATIPVGQILVGLGFFGGVLFLLMALRKGHRPFVRAYWTPLLVLRAASEGVVAVTFVTALALVDISTVAAVFQTTPLATTLGAALFLGEKVGWRRWTAILVGFSGVLLIVRPGFASFDPAILLVLATVVCIAFRDLVTRAMDVSVPSMVVGFQAFAAVVPAGALLLIFGGQTAVTTTPAFISILLTASTFSVIGYFALVTALRIAETAVIMPFRYARLVFSMITGVIVFGERPDLAMLIGSALIIGAGLYTFMRERQLARTSP
ncbi:DMT family transporter [Celeribacter sp.]|uniref:DMT family transporter n=1 Tax=Celeribacter sp. TaxID=1890673 RepID=UPI003A94410C